MHVAEAALNYTIRATMLAYKVFRRPRFASRNPKLHVGVNIVLDMALFFIIPPFCRCLKIEVRQREICQHSSEREMTATIEKFSDRIL